MRIGIACNLKTATRRPPSPGEIVDLAEEFDLPETLEAIRQILTEAGHEVFSLGGDLGVLNKIRENGVEFVFNLAEGFRGRSREAQLPALFEMLGLPYSGSDPVGLGTTLDKSLAKRVALSLGVPTPEFWVLDASCQSNEVPEKFPLFVKPLWQGSSIGIYLNSKVENRSSLERAVRYLFERYPGEPVLVEEYIAGREVTVGVLGNDPPEILGSMEIAFRDPQREDFSYSREVKLDWKEQVDYYVPPRLGPEIVKAVEGSALCLFTALRLRDFARFDFRVSTGGTFYFLEANPLAGLSPTSGDLVILADKKGWSYRELILTIVRNAWSRYPKLMTSCK